MRYQMTVLGSLPTEVLQECTTGTYLYTDVYCTPNDTDYRMKEPSRFLANGDNIATVAQESQLYDAAPKEESAVGLDTKTNAVIVKVLAKPGAKSNGITDINPEGVGVQIAAPPVGGEANTELIKYLAKVLGVRKSDVSLDRGSKSRNKTLVVCGDLTVEGVLASLQKEISNG